MEEMNEKKRSASSEASPRSNITRSKKCSLVNETFASVRDNGVLVTMICSFLPIKDRVWLGLVDKQFYADERRGHLVGIYMVNTASVSRKRSKRCAIMTLEHSLDGLITLPSAALGTTSQNAKCCVGGRGSCSLAGSTRNRGMTSKLFEGTIPCVSSPCQR